MICEFLTIISRNKWWTFLCRTGTARWLLERRLNGISGLPSIRRTGAETTSLQVSEHCSRESVGRCGTSNNTFWPTEGKNGLCSYVRAGSLLSL